MLRSSTLLGLGLGLLLGNACTTEPSVDPEACQMIIDACHTKDDGSDDVINGCHSNAHDGKDAACTNDLQMCLDVCNAAPDVGSHGSGGSDESGYVHEGSGTSGSGTGGGTSGADGSTSHGTSSTGADDSSQASCAELSSICHDVADDVGLMCHEVGHGGDEAACAEVWVQCIEHCTA